MLAGAAVAAVVLLTEYFPQGLQLVVADQHLITSREEGMPHLKPPKMKSQQYLIVPSLLPCNLGVLQYRLEPVHQGIACCARACRCLLPMLQEVC